MEQGLSAAEARKEFSELINAAGYAGRATVIKRNNRPVAVIIGYREYQEFLSIKKYLQEREARFAIYDEIRARNLKAGPEQVEADVVEAVRTVRETES